MNSLNYKVLFIHHGSLHGGAPLSLLYTAQGVKKKGYLVTIGMVKKDDDLNQFYKEKGFDTVFMPWIKPYFFLSASPQPWNKLHTYSNLIRQIKHYLPARQKSIDFFAKNHFDLVHLNSVTLINTAVVLMELKKKMVWHVREYAPSRQDFRFRYFKKRLLKAPVTIYLSKAEKNSWIGKNTDGNIIHNFVDLEKFRPLNPSNCFKEKYQLSSSDFIILYVGGFKHFKGIDCLLKALSHLKKKGIKLKCLMPGTLVGKDIEKWNEKIKKLEIENICILEEFIPDIRSFYAVCDVLIFPATVPHFARPVIEAAAMSKPSIVSNIKPMNELVIPDKTGLLFEVNNSFDLANKIYKIFMNPYLGKKMGLIGRIYAQEKFDMNIQIEKICCLYQDYLTKKTNK